MKHNFFIKRNGYNVKRGPLKKHKIIPLNLILKVEKQYLKAFPSSKKLSILETYLPVCWAGEFWVKMRKKGTSWSTIIQGDRDKKVKLLLPQIKRFEKNVLSFPSLLIIPSQLNLAANPQETFFLPTPGTPMSTFEWQALCKVPHRSSLT